MTLRSLAKERSDLQKAIAIINKLERPNLTNEDRNKLKQEYSDTLLMVVADAKAILTAPDAIELSNTVVGESGAMQEREAYYNPNVNPLFNSIEQSQRNDPRLRGRT